MNTLYLHIGSRDTQTASLQSFLYANRSRLGESGVVYPQQALRGKGHGELATFCGQNGRAPDKASLRGICQSIVESLSDSDTSVLMSCEELGELQNIRPLTVLSEYFDVKIVLYVQRQDDYLQSLYQHHVLNYALRYSGSIYQFMLAHNFFTRLNYNHQVSRWENHFGQENIIVKACDASFSGGNIGGILLSVVGAPSINDGQYSQESDTQVSLAAIPYISHLNQLSLTRRQHETLVSSVNSTALHEENLSLLRLEDGIGFYKKFEQSNRLLFERHLNGDLESFERSSEDGHIPRWVNHENIDIQKLLAYVEIVNDVNA